MPLDLPPAVTIEHREVILAKAQEHGIDPALLAALVCMESRGNHWSHRYEPDYRWLYPYGFPVRNIGPCSQDTEECAQKMSWGLGQVMGAVAREQGFKGAFLAELVDPATGLEYACRLLAVLLKKYKIVEKAVSAYNAGHATDKNKHTYVEPVMAYRDALRPHFQVAGL
jgi:hypothetical protein